jgi:hypothetical protein
MQLEKYSIGIGDRFAHEGTAQLHALQKAEMLRISIVPVWNKSNREHSIIGTSPADTRRAADEAVQACRWRNSYYVDADHIGINTVDRFLDSSNFFTIDVADFIGKPAPPETIASFVRATNHLLGDLAVRGISSPIQVTEHLLWDVAGKYLYAVEEASRVYRRIVQKKTNSDFVTEVSFDEANEPQTPVEMLLILAAIAHAGIPIQTIAPKFAGSFLKGIDYVGDTRRFANEFEDDLAVLAFAIETFHLPKNLKLSVHSGSDKFSLYPIMHAAIKKHNAGLHLKTAGTTWLEEVIGLAASGGDGLRLAKQIYAEAYRRFDELAKPYLTVIQIDTKKLPEPSDVNQWSSDEYVEALRHDPSCSRYDRNFRQLVHIGYKVAAEMGDRFMRLLDECRREIEANVTENILERHILPLFPTTKTDGQDSQREPTSAIIRD